MSKLIELNNLNVDNFIEMLRDSNIFLYENIQGSKIFIEYNGEEFIIRTKSPSNHPINKVDLALQKYYHKAFNYLDFLDERVKKLIPKNYQFCCQYFPDEKPAHIKYDKLPDNNLILSSIVKNNKFSFDYNEILEFSNLLNITAQPIIFSGKLTPKQIELIKLFLLTKKEDIEIIFGENNDNFASFFYKILNPSYKNSLLMDEGSFQEHLDKLIIKIDDKDEISFTILNPLYTKSDNKIGDYSETYSIIILDFLEFLQTFDYENRYLKGNTTDSIYIDVISDLFNRYVEDRGWRIKNFQFNIPLFFYEDKFKLNKEFITNKNTRYLIDSSEKMEFILKILLQYFRVKKDKPFGLFNNNTWKIFNTHIDNITRMIDKALRIEREDELAKHNLLDFGTFFKIKYPQGDGEGKLYPDLYNKIDNDNTSNQNKKDKINTVNKKGQ